jgi:ParB family chromosome partitioning protein
LMTELTAHRTLALRHALGEQPDVAFLAALHALCIKIFYRYAVDSCLELDVKSVSFGAQAPGLNDTALAANFDRRHQAWIAALPKEPAELWDTLTAFDGDSRQALFMHCISLSINAMFELYNRRPRALAHADRLAEVLDLDMVAAGWTPTVENYLGRVTKARILGAVRESKGERAAQLIDHLKKGEMAEKAEVLLAGSGWLPEPLRTPGRAITSSSSAAQQEHPDMVLLHGGSPKGAERIAARWADHRKVPQIAFRPDWTKHNKAAPFKRNDQMLDVLPIGVMVFPGTGIQDNLADKARKFGIPVWKFGNRGA